MKASEDFLRVVLYSYIVVSVTSCNRNASDDAEINSKTVVDLVVKKYVRIDLPESCDAISDDSIYNYILDLTGVGMMWPGFHDAIWEGEGERVI